MSYPTPEFIVQRQLDAYNARDVDALMATYPQKVNELKSLMETWMKQAGAKNLTPNPAYDASRPLFNTRDEALKKEREGKKAKK